MGVVRSGRICAGVQTDIEITSSSRRTVIYFLATTFSCSNRFSAPFAILNIPIFRFTIFYVPIFFIPTF